MAEYVERESIFSLFDKDTVFGGSIITLLKSVEPTDVAPVVHGRWIFDHMTGERSYYARCSSCRKMKFFEYKESEPPYCDMCGAKMDGGDNDGLETP